MAQSELNVVNLALRLIGSRAVLTTMGDTSVEGLACAALIEPCRQALIRDHPWNFAIDRDKLEYSLTAVASAIAADGATTTVIDVTSHGFAVNDWIMIVAPTSSVAPVAGLTGVPVKVTAVPSANQFKVTLAYTSITGTFTANVLKCHLSNPYQFTYNIALPSGLLRVLKINEETSHPDWRIEGGRLLTNEGTNYIQFVGDVTTYTLLDPQFYQALAHYLAYTLCDHITASDGKKAELHSYLYGGGGRRGILPTAKFTDANENPAGRFVSDDWLDSRLGGLAVL